MEFEELGKDLSLAFNTVEAAMRDLSYSRENAVFSQLSHLRKLEFEVTGRRDTLFEDYTKVLTQEADVLGMFSSIQQRKKEMESCFRDFQNESGFKSQIEQKEIELKDAHQKAEEAREVVITSFETTRGELQRVNDRHETDRKLLEAVTEKKTRLKKDLEAIEKNLESEKEKALCQICVDRTRDTVVLLCMHYVYCNSCLVTHQQKNNKCPACRVPIAALLLCKLGIE